MVNFKIMLKNNMDVCMSKNTSEQEHLHDFQLHNPVLS